MTTKLVTIPARTPNLIPTTPEMMIGTLMAGNSIAHHNSCPAAFTSDQISFPIHSSSQDCELLLLLRFYDPDITD